MVPPSAQQSRPKAPLALRAALHLLGWSLVAVAMLWPALSGAAWQALGQSWQEGSFWRMSLGEGLLHVGLSGCAWAALVLLWTWMRQSLGARRALRVVRQSRGAVILETLVVFPVLLLLIFGIAQLAVVNIAGLLANLATFEAARTAWVWEREPCAGSDCDPADFARIQAALVLAPVAPGDYGAERPGESTAMIQARGILVGSQRPWPTTDMGYDGMRMADQALADTSDVTGANQNFALALDQSSFMTRSARKFSFAYQATSVQLSSTDTQISVELTYRHFCAFPVANRVFGEQDLVAGIKAYYSVITRSYTQSRLPAPNRKMPTQVEGGPRMF